MNYLTSSDDSVSDLISKAIEMVKSENQDIILEGVTKMRIVTEFTVTVDNSIHLFFSKLGFRSL